MPLSATRLALGASLCDPTDPMGRLWTKEGMAIARAKGKIRRKQPRLSENQQKDRARMQATGDCSISDLAELFAVSRPTVYTSPKRAEAKISPWRRSLPRPGIRPRIGRAA